MVESSNNVTKLQNQASDDEDDYDEENDAVEELQTAPIISSKGGVIGNQQQNILEPIEWNQYFDELEMYQEVVPIYYAGLQNTQGRVYMMIHGAGHTALSFSLLANLLKTEQNSTVVAYDLKNHGQNKITENSEDMSLETLTKDALKVLEHICTKFENRSVTIVGHSMGGCIATNLALQIQKSRETSQEENKQENQGQESETNTAAKLDQVQSLFILETVEDTVLSSIGKKHTEQFFVNRQTEFNTVVEAIEYVIKSKTVRNHNSARVSVPYQVTEFQQEDQVKYKWIYDLEKSQEHWEDWFKGQSARFRQITLPKMVMLAHSQHTDKGLSMGYVQGQFKQLVVQNSGHCLMEDQPDEVARLFKEFNDKFKLSVDPNQKRTVVSMSGKQIEVTR